MILNIVSLKGDQATTETKEFDNPVFSLGNRCIWNYDQVIASTLTGETVFSWSYKGFSGKYGKQVEEYVNSL